MPACFSSRLLSQQATILTAPSGSTCSMLALFAGRERNEGQWRELLEATGFEPLSIEDGLIQARCR